MKIFYLYLSFFMLLFFPDQQGWSQRNVSVSSAADVSWIVPLTISLSTGSSDSVVFGTKSGATNGLDPGIDLLNPPPPPNGFDAFFEITHPLFPNLSEDYRATTTIPLYWTLQVIGASGNAGTLSWDITEFTNSQPALRKLEIRSGNNVLADMLAVNSLNFAGDQDLIIAYEALVPDITVSPVTHDFGDVMLGSSATKTFVVSNTGTADLQVNTTTMLGANAAEFTITSGGAPFTLIPGQNRNLVVSFSPATLGAKNATLQIISNDPDESPLEVSLTGNAIPVPVPDISVSPITYDFGDVMLGSNATKTFVVSNTGTADLQVSTTSLLGADAAEFTITSDGAPFTLIPGQSRNLGVRFSPTTLGVKSATLQITSNDPNESPLDVSLTGNAIPVIVPDIAVSPVAYNFGDVMLGSSAAKTFVFSNTGTADLQVSITALLGTDAAEFTITSGGAPFTLTPGQNRNLVVRFSPLTLGAKSATLQIISNDPDESPLEVPLTGNAIPVPVPDIAISPITYAFGDVMLGSSATKTFVVSNTGTADLQVSTTASLGTDAAEFTITSGGAPFTLIPGQNRNLVVSFSPATLGAKNATLQLISNDPDESPFDVPLTGNAIPVPLPDIAVSPITYDFGDVMLGSSATETFVVSNTGIADLLVSTTTLLGTDAAEFTITSGGAPFTLTPGQSRNLIVRFTPSTLGAKNATLQIISNDPDESPLEASLTGNGIPVPIPDIAVSPVSYNFGDVMLGLSATKTFVVSNTGTADLQVSVTSLLGADAAEFTITSGGAPFTLMQGQNRNLVVRFSPATLGAKNATLQIVSNDLDESPFNVSLTGNAIPVPVPDIAVAPRTYNFGDVMLGSSATKTFVVSNTGTADLQVSTTSLLGANAAEFTITSSGAPLTLKPGQSQNLIVRFSPSSLGEKNATLQIICNDPDESPLAVSLSGNAVPAPVPDIDLSCVSHDFGDVTLGSSAFKTFVVSNTGTANLYVRTTSLLGPDANSFTIEGGGAPFSLSPGQSRNLVVRFSPSSLGAKSATLQIISNDPDESPLEVPLTGNGISVPIPDITVSPGTYNFGEVMLGSSATKTFVISNNGSADLQVSTTTLLGTNATEFTITSGGAPFTLSPGQGRNLVVRFSPNSLGAKNATLQITSNDPDENLLNVSLAGAAVAPSEPDISVTPSSQNFCDVSYCDVALGSSLTKTFVISNTGTADLQVYETYLTGANATEFAITSGGAPFTLAPGETHHLVMRFAPVSAGPKNSILRITSNDPDENPFDVALNANAVVGPASNIVTDSSSYDYGDVALGSSAVQIVAVSNVGIANLQVYETTLLGAQASKFVIEHGTAPFTLGRGESREIVIRLRPDALDTLSATLRLISNDPDENPLDLRLKGRGISSGTPDLAVDSVAHHYGDITLGSSGVATFVVRNTGSANLHVNATTLVGTDSALFSVESGGAPFTLARNERREIMVAFRPDTLGAKRAKLRLDSDDLDQNPFEMTLTGNGIATGTPDITVAPATHDYGDVALGSYGYASFAIRNVGTANLAVTATTLVGANADQYANSGGSASFTLRSGEIRQLAVRFTPNARGLKNAMLQIASDDPDENPFEVDLIGNGIGINGCDISGKVTYCPTGEPVRKVTMTLTGAVFSRQITDALGTYIFENLESDSNYTVTPAKTNDLDPLSITAYDAALTARLAVGLDSANHCDSLAADVDENGMINTFDAALICRHAIELPHASEQDHSGEWRFAPRRRSYTPLQRHQRDQDYVATLLGDVDGNWIPDSSLKRLPKSEKNLIRFVEDLQWSEDGKQLTTALHFDGGVSALAFDLEISYDPRAVKFFAASCPLKDWNLLENHAEAGRLRLGMFATEVLAVAAEIVEIKWEKVTSQGNTRLTIEHALVNREAQTKAEWEILLGEAIPQQFALFQNYPNPFNPETTIRYTVPAESRNKTQVTLRIHNLQGQVVRTLVDEEKPPGSYRVVWDGRSDDGVNISSGVYFYTMTAANFKSTRKMIVLQ